MIGRCFIEELILSIRYWFQILPLLPFIPVSSHHCDVVAILFSVQQRIQVLFPQSLDANYAKFPKKENSESTRN